MIGRIKACAIWRAAGATAGEDDRLVALQALIREAEDYDADAIIGLDFEIDGVSCVDIGGAPLQRVAATGIAVKFAQDCEAAQGLNADRRRKRLIRSALAGSNLGACSHPTPIASSTSARAKAPPLP